MKSINSKWTVVCTAILIAAIYGWNLNSPVLWGDEAGTAAFSRNVLQYGVPYGFDGRNLLVYNNCASISPALLSSKIPWLQYYIGAASLMLFGESTLGSRLLFALIGACALFPLVGVLRRRSCLALPFSVLLLLMPQVILFQRNARYFAVAIFLYCLLLWLLDRPYRLFKIRFAALGLLFVAFFQLHQLAAVCTAVCVVLIDSLRFRKIPWDSLGAVALGCGSWVAFYIAVGTVDKESYTIIRLLTTSPAEWGRLFGIGLKAGLFDLDTINALPILAWAAAIACFCIFKPLRERMAVVWKDPVCQIIGVNLALQIVATAALLGYETEHRFSLLRYMPHLICLAPLPLLLLIEKMPATDLVSKFRLPLICLVIAAILGTNLFSLSFWLLQPQRESTATWWRPVYAEILNPGPDAIAECMTLLKENAGTHKNKAVWAVPSYMNEIFIFYAGDDYLIIPKVVKGSTCENVIVETIGFEPYARFDRQPDWIFLFFRELEQTPQGYQKMKIPIYREAADAHRPELTRHDFPAHPDAPKGYVTVYRRRY